MDVDYSKITDVSGKLSSGEMYSKYGLEILNNYPTKEQAEKHEKHLKENGFNPVVIEDKETFYLFVKDRKTFKYKKGGEMNHPDWLFIGQYPNAVVYADKTIEDKDTNDYHAIAHVVLEPLEIKIFDNSPKYKIAIDMAKKEFLKREGNFENLDIKENTPDDSETDIIKYKGIVAVRNSKSQTQGDLILYKDGEKVDIFSLEKGLSGFQKDKRWLKNDGEVRKLIDDFLEKQNMENEKYENGGEVINDEAITADPSNLLEDQQIQNPDITSQKYIPKSIVCEDLDTTAPVSMLYDMNKSLTDIDRKVRGIDDFVMKKLGYDNLIDLCRAFGAEQVDGVANAIYQIEQGAALIVGDMTGVGKGRSQPLDAKILTKKGFVNMGDLKIGDKIISVDGNETSVIGIFPQGKIDVYKVEFSDGSSTECSEDHLWNTRSRSAKYNLKENPNSEYGKYKVSTTKELMPKLKQSHSIPLVNAINFDYKEVNIDPYLLGILLGDACIRSHSVELTSNDDEIISSVKDCLFKMDENLTAKKFRHQHYQLSKEKNLKVGKGGENKLVTELRKLGLNSKTAEFKFIPESYKINSKEVRLGILQGLLDSDGYASSDGSCMYYTSSERLAKDVEFIVRSLGGTTTRGIKKEPKYKKYKTNEVAIGKPCHIVYVKLPNEFKPFRLLRKANRIKDFTKYFPQRVIRSIIKVGKKECQCIQVDHESSLYVTDDFIVTHNTAAGIMRYAKLIGKTPIFFSEKPNLFTDIYRDLIAIGSDDGVPLYFKGKEVDRVRKVTKKTIVDKIVEDIDNGEFDLEYDTDKLFTKEYEKESNQCIEEYRELYFPSEIIKELSYSKNPDYERQIKKANCIVPFIVNSRSSSTEIKDEDGNVIYESVKPETKREVFASKKLPKGYNAVVLTYSQVNSPARAKEKIEWLMSVANDSIVVMDECFSPETKIDGIPIKDIKVGDIVRSYNHSLNVVEYKEVKTVFIKEVKEIIKVTFSNGVMHYVTGNHPYFSPDENDYVAIQEKLFTFVASITQEENEKKKKMGKNAMHNVWHNKGNYNGEGHGTGKKRSGVLFGRMHEEVLFSEIVREWEEIGGIQSERGGEVSGNEGEQSNEESYYESQSFNKTSSNGSQTNYSERERTHIGSSAVVSNGNGLGYGGGSKNITETAIIPTSLQAGYSKRRFNDSNRGGRIFTQVIDSTRTGQKKRSSIERVRVESIEILKRGSGTEFERVCPQSLVYNIEVEDNNNYFVENILVHNCHNASGSSQTGRFLQNLLNRTAGVCYLSATFAKRPDNMPIYAMKTCIQDAEMDNDTLIEAILSGGVALQEILSSDLVSEGQMIRRERSYEGVVVNYNYLDERMMDRDVPLPQFNLKEIHEAISDKITNIIRRIITFQKDKINTIISDKDEEFKAMQAQAGVDVKNMEGGINNPPVFSGVFNLINQLLFSIKADAVAEFAIMRMKEGKKVVIGFGSTLESFLDYLVQDESDKIKTDFSIIMKRRLEKVLEYTVTYPSGDKEKQKLNPDDFPTITEEYYSILEEIQAASTGITISPIDRILVKIKEAGFKVGEVTGRKKYVHFFEDGIHGAIKTRVKQNANDLFRKFNDNELDCLLINQAGATGASAQAIKTKKAYVVNYNEDGTPKIPTSLEPTNEVKQRVMVILQAELDVNKEVQKRGRINRTGQVFKPIYDYVISGVPAEERLMMMLQKKLKSLDANTTSNQKQSKKLLDVVDFLNIYGDVKVVDFMKDNPSYNEMTGNILKFEGGQPSESTERVSDKAHKVSGRVAILPVELQSNFYRTVSETYETYETQLRQTGEWNLEVENMNLDAKTLQKDVVSVGNPEKKSVFGGAVFMEKCLVNNLRKPYSKKEVDTLISNALTLTTPEGNVIKLSPDEKSEFYIKKFMERMEDNKKWNEETAERRRKEDLEALKNSPSLAKKEKEEREAYLAEKELAIQEEYKRRIESFDASSRYLKQTIVGAFEFFKVKRLISYPMSVREGEKTNVIGICLGIYVNMKAGNPFAPSQLMVKFVMPNGLKLVKFTLSDSYVYQIKDSTNTNYETKNNYENDVNYFLEKWDETIKEASANRVIRYIVTGNILKGYGNADVRRGGKLISYTVEGGGIKKGILLPEGYEAKDVRVKVPINKAINYLGGMRDGTTVFLHGEDVSIQKRGQFYNMKVKKSKNEYSEIVNDADINSFAWSDKWDLKKGFYENRFEDPTIKKLATILGEKYKMNVEITSSAFEAIKDQFDVEERDKVTMDGTEELIKKHNKLLEEYERSQDFKVIDEKELKKLEDFEVETYELKKRIAELEAFRRIYKVTSLLESEIKKRKREAAQEAGMAKMKNGGAIKINSIADLVNDDKYTLVTNENEIKELAKRFKGDSEIKPEVFDSIGGAYVKYGSDGTWIESIYVFEGQEIELSKPVYELYPINEYLK